MHRTTRTARTRSTGALSLAAVAAIALGACTDAGDAAIDEPTASETPVAVDTVTVTGVDYGFELIEGDLPVGTALAFENASDAEFHEMVVMRIDDDETRSVQELLALPEDEAMESTSFVGVAVAAPGEAGTVADGDLTLTEPGRYALLCFIPVGADPEAVAAAMQGASEDAPPDLGDGAPHFVEGMATEITVAG